MGLPKPRNRHGPAPQMAEMRRRSIGKVRRAGFGTVYATVCLISGILWLLVKPIGCRFGAKMQNPLQRGSAGVISCWHPLCCELATLLVGVTGG